MKHKILSLIIAVTMLFSTAGFAFAAEGNAVENALALLNGLDEVTLEEADDVAAARAAYDALDKFEKADYGLTNYIILAEAEVTIENLKLEALIAEGNYDLAEIEAVRAALEEATADYNSALNALVVFKTKVKEVKISQNKSAVKASWTPVDGAYKYVVKLYKDGKLVKNSTKYVKGTATSYTNLLRGSKYKVWVKPYAQHKGVNYFGKVNHRFSSEKKLAFKKPELTVVKNGKYRTIKAPDQNSTGFQVWVAKDKNFKKTVKKVHYSTNKGALNKKVVAKTYLKKGNKTNFIKVRPYSTVNGKKVYGPWSKVKTIKK